MTAARCLSPEMLERAAVAPTAEDRAHLAACPQCRGAVGDRRAMNDEIREALRVEIDPAKVDAIWARLEERPVRLPRRVTPLRVLPWLASAAAAAAVVALVHRGGPSEAPSEVVEAAKPTPALATPDAKPTLPAPVLEGREGLEAATATDASAKATATAIREPARAAVAATRRSGSSANAANAGAPTNAGSLTGARIDLAAPAPTTRDESLSEAAHEGFGPRTRDDRAREASALDHARMNRDLMVAPNDRSGVDRLGTGASALQREAGPARDVGAEVERAARALPPARDGIAELRAAGDDGAPRVDRGDVGDRGGQADRPTPRDRVERAPRPEAPSRDDRNAWHEAARERREAARERHDARDERREDERERREEQRQRRTERQDRRRDEGRSGPVPFARERD